MKISGLLTLTAASRATALVTDVGVENIPIETNLEEIATVLNEHIEQQEESVTELIKVVQFNPEGEHDFKPHNFKPCHSSKNREDHPSIHNEDESWFDRTLDMVNEFFNGEEHDDMNSEDHELDEMRPKKHGKGPKHHKCKHHRKHHGPPPPPHHDGPPPPPPHHDGPPPPPPADGENKEGPEHRGRRPHGKTDEAKDEHPHHRDPEPAPGRHFRQGSKKGCKSDSKEVEYFGLNSYVDIDSIHEYFRGAFRPFGSEGQEEGEPSVDPAFEICKGFLGGVGLLALAGGAFKAVRTIKRRQNGDNAIRLSTDDEESHLDEEVEGVLPEFSEKSSVVEKA